MVDLQNNLSKILIIVAVVTLLISLFSAGIIYFSAGNLVNVFSGRVTGEANLTIETVASINFTRNSLNWQSGRVTDGFTMAYLDTAAGTVKNGNWTAVSSGLKIENLGNVNVSLNLSVTKTAATFFGGTNPSYKWNITNGEANSCVNLSGGTGNNLSHLGIYYDPNISSANWCPLFQFIDSKDVMNISINLTIPSDSITGTLGEIITATAVAV